MLYDNCGSRKYLNDCELNQFIASSQHLELPEGSFARFLLFSGCRISEALELTPHSIDTSSHCIIIRTLKRRSNTIYRIVPLPLFIERELMDHVHTEAIGSRDRIWPWSRTKGWCVIKSLMSMSGIDGAKACPKGLRHSFAVAAIQNGVPLNLVQKWLGHARIETTAIYADATGAEERRIANRLWRSLRH